MCPVCRAEFCTGQVITHGLKITDEIVLPFIIIIMIMIMIIIIIKIMMIIISKTIVIII